MIEAKVAESYTGPCDGCGDESLESADRPLIGKIVFSDGSTKLYCQKKYIGEDLKGNTAIYCLVSEKSGIQYHPRCKFDDPVTIPARTPELIAG